MNDFLQTLAMPKQFSVSAYFSFVAASYTDLDSGLREIASD